MLLGSCFDEDLNFHKPSTVTVSEILQKCWYLINLVVGSAHWLSPTVTSAQHSFDFKRYSPNLPTDALLYMFYTALHFIGCCDSYSLPVTYLICLLVLWDCHIWLKESLMLIRAAPLGSHKGSPGFCKSLHFPLQNPLPAVKQLPSIKGERKGAVERWLWLWVKMVICSILENVLTSGIKASCHSLLTERKHVTRTQPQCLQHNCNAWLYWIKLQGVWWVYRS